MDRSEIYSRYVTGSFSAGDIDRDYKGYLTYRIWWAVDSGTKFCMVSFNDCLKLSDDILIKCCKTVHSGNRCELIIDLGCGYSFIDTVGVPIVKVDGLHKFMQSLVKKFLDGSGEEITDITIDLSKTDLNDIIDASALFLLGHYNILKQYKIKYSLPVGDMRLQPAVGDYMFYGNKLSNINEIIQKIDFSDIETAKNMFEMCKGLGDLHFYGADFVKCKSTKNMFKDCLDLLSIDGDTGCFSSVRITYGMFIGCEKLKRVDTCIFEGDSGHRHIEDTSYMFDGCDSLEDIDISDMINIMLTQAVSSCMFRNCSKVKWYTENKKPIWYCHAFFREDYKDSHIRILGHTGALVIDIRGFRYITEKGEKLLFSAGFTAKAYDIINSLPRILIVDKEQYYTFLYGINGVDVINLQSEDINNAIKKISLFNSGNKTIIVESNNK